MKPDRTYRADLGSYFLWLGLLSLPLLPMAAVLAGFGWSEFQARGMIMPTGLFIAAIGISAIWLSRYRLTFTKSGVSYRSWRRSWSCSYDQIIGVSASRVAPLSQIPLGAYVHFQDGRRELVYTKAFSRAAIKDLFSLAAA